jgi:hypothetical protein
VKEAISAGNAQVEVTRKQFAEIEEQLRRELEEARRQLQDEKEHLEAVQVYLTGIEDMVKDTDAKAVGKFPLLSLIRFRIFTSLLIHRPVLTLVFFTLCPELFPDSQMRAETAVAKSRVDYVVDANLPWTTKDYLTALYCRITHMRAVDRTLGLLPGAAITAFKSLWPDEPIPDSTNLVAERLQGTRQRLHEWRHSSARAGADMALRFACSWYEGLDMDALHSMREDAPTNKDLAKDAARRARAYKITSYARPNTFIPPLADLQEEFTDDEEEEEDEETGDGDAEAEAEVHEERAAGAPEPAPTTPEVPEVPDVPASQGSALESSSPLYQ